MSIKVDKVLILNKIKFHYGFNTDAEFARFLNIKPQTLSSWYSRNTFDVDLLYAKCIDIRAEFILSGKEPVAKRNDLIVQETKLDYMRRIPQIVTVDSHNKDNIVLVPGKLKAGYLEGFNDKKFISKLPTYRMPGLNNGVFRMFEMEGTSMFPTIPPNSYVVGQFVDNWITGIKDNQIYAVISNEVEDGLLKRCINRIEKYGNLLCKSDNRKNYPTQNISPESIKEIWEVKLHLNFNLADPSDLYDRMNDLEADNAEIKQLLMQLTKNQTLK